MLMLPFAARSCAPFSLDISTGGKEDVVIRIIDVLIAAAAIAMLLPLLLLVGAMIWASDGQPPLFFQRRIGLGGRSFRCLKFRTMACDADRQLAALIAYSPAILACWRRHHKLAGDPRITPLGRLLRVASIDELPQLLNVIAGDMSLVGPRPIVASEVPRYGRHFATYCHRRPGLSGLWQVSGRSTLSYARRLACDRLFARRCSLALYCRILLATVPTVLLARGAC